MENPSFRKSEQRTIKSTPSGMRLRRILAPLDFLDSTIEVLRTAAAFAREHKAMVTLLHVVKPDGSHVRRNITRERLIDELSEAGELQIHKLVDVIWGEEITTDIVVASGKPHLQIVNEARETNADMIMMASHGAVGSWGFFRRSTATKVVRYAPCPVLVVPSLGRSFVMDASSTNGPDR